MKLGFATFLILSFVSMAGFGFLAMSLQGDMHECFAAVAKGVECPIENGIFSSLSFHTGVVKSFSTATVGTFLLASFLFAVLVLALQYRSNDAKGLFLATYFYCKQRVQFFTPILKQRILYWLSLHENSPAFV